MEAQLAEKNTVPRQISLKEVIDSIQSKAAQFSAIYFNTSKLMAYNRQPHQLRQMLVDLNRIFSNHSVKTFCLKNNDIVCLIEKASIIVMERAISQFKRTVGDDPLLTDSHKRELFVFSYDLGLQWRDFCISIAEVEDNPLYSARSRDMNSDSSPPLLIDGIKVETLALIENTLKQSDVTSLVRRQGVYWHNGKENPRILTQHFYLSLQDLQNTLKISESLTGNTWLFKQITVLLDRQMIKALPKLLQQKSIPSIHLNLNLRSLVTSHFRDFLVNYNGDKEICMFFDLVDILAHPDVLSYGSEILKPKNIMIGVNNIVTKQLPYINFDTIPVDLFKINNSEDFINYKETLEKFVKQIGNQRVILHKCDNDKDIKTGIAVGIEQFQGRGMDHLAKTAT